MTKNSVCDGVGATAIALCAALFAQQGMAQNAATLPVKFIVPYPAGASYDRVGRSLAERLAVMWKRAVVVENRPGGNEIVAASFVAKAPPDGNTLFLAADPTLSHNMFLYRKLPYDTVRDFVPITRVAQVDMALMVRSGLPVNSLSEFIMLAKRNRGAFNYGSSGAGGAPHIAMELLKMEAGMGMTHVAYKGLAPALQDLMGGQIDATFAGGSDAERLLPSGKVKVLAVSGAQRLKKLPAVPTFAELGYPHFEARFAMGLLAPAGTPKETVEAIAKDVRQVLSDKAFVAENMESVGFAPVLETPAQFEAYLVRDRVAAKARIAATRITLD